MKHSVDPEAYEYLVLARLHVDVGSPYLQRLPEKTIDELDHGDVDRVALDVLPQKIVAVVDARHR